MPSATRAGRPHLGHGLIFIIVFLATVLRVFFRGIKIKAFIALPNVHMRTRHGANAIKAGPIWLCVHSSASLFLSIYLLGAPLSTFFLTLFFMLATFI